jgi:mannose/fructose/N-acetylgalactosamine-specific phosphotransferase system component IIB
LIHGQVLEAWVPHLKISRLVVCDDEAAGNRLMRAAMTMAVPDGLEVVISKVDQTDFRSLAMDEVKTLVLLRDVAAAVTARRLGLPDGPLNVGNVHAGIGREQVTRAVFLSKEEQTELKGLGMRVTLQAVPSEAPVALG